MRITSDNLYSDFLWFYGKSAIDQSGGYWILKENPVSQASILRIDWRRVSNITAEIKYTNTVPGSADNGSYIFNGLITGEYNRFFNIYNHNLNNLTEIEWNAESRIGHVKDPGHFQDALWHCWQSNLSDMVCP